MKNFIPDIKKYQNHSYGRNYIEKKLPQYIIEMTGVWYTVYPLTFAT